MLNLPTDLCPTSVESVRLSDGRVVEIPKANPTFSPWLGETTIDDFGGKPILDDNGAQAFAELVILRKFLASGWSARWVETYGAPNMRPRLLTDWDPRGIKQQDYGAFGDPHISARLDSIARANGNSYAGCWDVVAWDEGTILFAEAKFRKHDRMRDTQRRWFAAALAHGIPATSFLVVEWSLRQDAQSAPPRQIGGAP